MAEWSPWSWRLATKCCAPRFQTCPQSAGDLDVAVQALKATTGLTDLPASQAENRENEANAPTDDDLKPCFMRRVALDKSPDGRSSLLETALQTEACMHDGNPRPVVRRRTEPTNAATQAAAKAVLQASS